MESQVAQESLGMVDLFVRGGPVMYLLLTLSVYAVAVVIYKAYQFHKLRVLHGAFVEPLLKLARERGVVQALGEARKIPGPVARVMEASFSVLTNRNIAKDDRQEEIARVGNNELQHLETHLRGLEMVAHAAPLLGLLGTVTGIIQTFSRLEESGARIDPMMLAGGIWEALVATATGLIVAIPALAAHYFINGMVERARLAMQDAGIRVLALEEFIRREELDLAARQKALEQEQIALEIRRREAQENRALEAQIGELEARRQELQAFEEKLKDEQDALAEKRRLIDGSDLLKTLSPRYA